MQIDPTRIPSDGWTANGLPDFPCSPNPQLDDLVELGRNVAHIDEVIAFLEGGFCSTLFAFGQVLRERLPTIEARLAADNIATLHQGSTDAIVFNGDLTIDGDVLQPSLLLVTGNLTVNGALRDTGRIAVLGDLRCRHVGTDAWVIVGGDCIADGFVHGSYNHNMFEVLGQLRAGGTHRRSRVPCRRWHCRHPRSVHAKPKRLGPVPVRPVGCRPPRRAAGCGGHRGVRRGGPREVRRRELRADCLFRVHAQMSRRMGPELFIHANRIGTVSAAAVQSLARILTFEAGGKGSRDELPAPPTGTFASCFPPPVATRPPSA